MLPLVTRGFLVYRPLQTGVGRTGPRWISSSVIRNMRGHRPQMISLPFLCLKCISLSWVSSISHYCEAEPRKQSVRLIKICSCVQLLHSMASSIVSWAIFWALRIKKLDMKLHLAQCHRWQKAAGRRYYSLSTYAYWLVCQKKKNRMERPSQNKTDLSQHPKMNIDHYIDQCIHDCRIIWMYCSCLSFIKVRKFKAI